MCPFVSASRDIFAAALASVDPKASAAAKKEKNWRFNYNKHIQTSMIVGSASATAALGVAQAGLKFLYETFDHIKVVRYSQSARRRCPKSLPNALGERRGSFPLATASPLEMSPASARPGRESS